MVSRLLLDNLMRSFIFIVVFAASTLAAAEPSMSPAPKRRDTALSLSIGTTGAGLALALIAADMGIRPQAWPDGVEPAQAILATTGGALLLVGPSLGSGYAHRLWNAGSIVRLSGIGVAALGVGVALALESRGEPGTVSPLPYIALASGGAIYLGGTVYEIATTPRAVDRYNRDHGIAPSLTPIRTRDGALAPAIGISGQF